MIKEAIVLAGGLGTRLKSVIEDIPKPMAPVNDKPFLAIVLEQLSEVGVSRVILSVGYKHEVIKAHFGTHWKGMTLDYAIEEEPLGTGGGIKLACDLLVGNEAFILNGDTFFDVPLYRLEEFHIKNNAQLTIALKPMLDFSRYGTVELDRENRISAFREKEHREEGLINGGVYVLNTAIFSAFDLPEKFSFEQNILEAGYNNLRFFGLPGNHYFIDIGIPEDYKRAQDEL